MAEPYEGTKYEGYQPATQGGKTSFGDEAQQWGRETMKGGWDMLTGKHKYRARGYDPDRSAISGNNARQMTMRYQQGKFNQELLRRAMGKGPSVAEQQMRAGMGAQIQAARSAAASARGGNIGLANRNASQQQAAALANTTRDAGMLRAQEMQNAGSLYAGNLQQQRGLDIETMGQEFGLQQALINAAAQRDATNAKIYEGMADRGQKGIGAMASMFGGALAAGGGALSDIRAKEDVKPMYSDFTMKEQAGAVAPAMPAQDWAQRLSSTYDAAGMQQAMADQQRRQQEAKQKQQLSSALANMGDQLSGGGGGDNSLNEGMGSLGSALGGMMGGGGGGGMAMMSDFNSKQDVAAPVYAQMGRGMDAGFDRALGSAQAQYDAALAREAQARAEAEAAVAPVSAGLEADFGARLAEAERMRQAALAREQGAPSPAENRQAMAPIKPVNYRYKPEAAARMAAETASNPAEAAMVYADKRAPRNGIIAQDLQKSPAFKDAVVQTPAGLAVDRDRALSESLAQLAAQNQRLAKVEKDKKKKGLSPEEIKRIKKELDDALKRGAPDKETA